MRKISNRAYLLFLLVGRLKRIAFLSVIWLPHSKLWAILGYCVFDLQVARSSVTRLDKNNLVSTDPRTDIHPLGFEPGFNCHVVIHSELPLACSFMPWLLDLQIRIEKNIHSKTFDDVPSRVFQIALKVMCRISLPNRSEWEILLGRTFYWVVGIWGWVILTIPTFKAKKQYSVNI